MDRFDPVYYLFLPALVLEHPCILGILLLQLALLQMPLLQMHHYLLQDPLMHNSQTEHELEDMTIPVPMSVFTNGAGNICNMWHQCPYESMDFQHKSR